MLRGHSRGPLPALTAAPRGSGSAASPPGASPRPIACPAQAEATGCSSPGGRPPSSCCWDPGSQMESSRRVPPSLRGLRERPPFLLAGGPGSPQGLSPAQPLPAPLRRRVPAPSPRTGGSGSWRRGRWRRCCKRPARSRCGQAGRRGDGARRGGRSAGFGRDSGTARARLPPARSSQPPPARSSQPPPGQPQCWGRRWREGAERGGGSARREREGPQAGRQRGGGARKQRKVSPGSPPAVLGEPSARESRRATRSEPEGGQGGSDTERAGGSTQKEREAGGVGTSLGLGWGGRVGAGTGQGGAQRRGGGGGEGPHLHVGAGTPIFRAQECWGTTPCVCPCGCQGVSVTRSALSVCWVRVSGGVSVSLHVSTRM
ncbi:uncharacterized protein ACOB8E_020956 [Sarcophilus harrisii]